MTWWHYLLLSNLYLVLFYGFYVLLLRRETFFQLNRIYLIGSALLSFTIPLVQSDWVRQWFITEKVRQTIYNAGPVIIHSLPPVQQEQVTIGQIILGIYLVGIAVLTIKLIWQLLALNHFIKTEQIAAAWSFFKKINVDEQLENHQVIMAHEEVHVRQWHSADVLLMEVIMIVNWFNPIVYLYRSSIRHIHEFIADRDALKAGASKAEYAMLLLSQTFGTPVHGLLNPFFNNSILKQRIVMLQKSNSNYAALIKYGFSAPLFALMLALSSATVNNSKVINGIHKKAEQVFLIPADSAMVTAKDSVAVQDSATGTPVSVPFSVNQIHENNKAEPAVGVQQAAEQPANTNKADNAENTHNEVFSAVEQNPVFPGGMEKFYNFIANLIRYPKQARDNNIQGRVIVTFIVEKDGSLSDVKVLRGPGYGLNEEAARAISASPKWIPAQQNGKTVRVQYTVPVVFTLEPNLNNSKDTSTAKIKQVRALSFKTLPYKQDVTDKADISDGLNREGANKLVLSNNSTGKHPLVLVDGKELPNSTEINKIDPSQIERIDVLKDQIATKAYGKKGSNGVVKITLQKKD